MVIVVVPVGGGGGGRGKDKEEEEEHGALSAKQQVTHSVRRYWKEAHILQEQGVSITEHCMRGLL